MSHRVRQSLLNALGELRHEPTAKHIRAVLGNETVVDSTRAVLLWEPRRVVPTYAVPTADVSAQLSPAAADSADATSQTAGFSIPDISRRPVLDPSIPFAVHTAEGQAVDLRCGGSTRPGAGFWLADPDLAGYLALDFAAFDAWYEEDQRILSHPRDPFHRIDVLASSRSIRIERDGEVLADSTRPTLLFETMLPTRYYLPRADVHVELIASQTQTYCAYKGQASYWSGRIGGELVPDLAWSYEEPLHEAAHVRGFVSFFDERSDVIVDGVQRERPVTRWASDPTVRPAER